MVIDEVQDLEMAFAALEERLRRLARELRALRRFVRQARPVDVPTLTAALHLLEAVAAGDPALEAQAERQGLLLATSRGSSWAPQ